MAEKQTFKTILKKHEKLDATGIEIPFDVDEIFGAKRVAVKAVINGEGYRGTIVRMGGKYMLGIPKAFREAAGINAGDEITVSVEKDVEKRTVAVPKDLATELKKAGLNKAWEGLSYTHRKEHVRAIEEAKQAETRVRRIEKAIAMIAAKKK